MSSTPIFDEVAREFAERGKSYQELTAPLPPRLQDILRRERAARMASAFAYEPLFDGPTEDTQE